jgi:hypothetical protein
MATTTSTDVAVIKPGGYLALNHSADEMAEMLDVLAENLGGESLTARDLPRIGIPAAGGLAWEIPTGDGDIEPSKTLTGIIVHFERTHSYWPPAQDSGTPPACSSVGPVTIAIGAGEPGGPCKTCPHNQFGTKVRPDGREAAGKACTERENWFLMVEDRPLPIVLSLSPASLKAAKQYRVDTLGSVGKRLSSVVTEITLANDTNATGEKYSYIVPRVAGNLSPTEAKLAREYAIGLRPVFAATIAAVAAEAQVSTAADIDSTATDFDPAA